MNKIGYALLLILLASTILFFSPIETASGQDLTDIFRAPAGIYQVSVSAPERVDVGEAFDVAVSVTVTGINESRLGYTFTVFEGIESIKVSLVEAGITKEKRIDTTMITNTNVSLIPSPVYVVNVTSIEHTFTFNSTFLNAEVYSLHILVKGFRWALLGLAGGSLDFYLEHEQMISITGTTTNDMLGTIQQLNSTIDELRQQMTTMTLLLYAAVGISVVGIIFGAIGVFLIRKRP